jgi:hypothetical protein
MLQLSYQSFQLQAFGLIATKLPTGPGYSMVAMIDATFPPIELVAGFTLNGVGGLLGVNRTISTDALEAGIKAPELFTLLGAFHIVSDNSASVGSLPAGVSLSTTPGTICDSCLVNSSSERPDR